MNLNNDVWIKKNVFIHRNHNERSAPDSLYAIAFILYPLYTGRYYHGVVIQAHWKTEKENTWNSFHRGGGEDSGDPGQTTFFPLDLGPLCLQLSLDMNKL